MVGAHLVVDGEVVQTLPIDGSIDPKSGAKGHDGKQCESMFTTEGGGELFEGVVHGFRGAAKPIASISDDFTLSIGPDAIDEEIP